VFFKNKQKQVQDQLAQYNEQVLTCMDVFQEAIRAYCENQDRDVLKESVQKVHRAEGLADDIRREIEVLMYTKALFPESRGDILGLLEAMDRVPNHTESTAHMILNHHIAMPEQYCSPIQGLVEITNRCVHEMINAVHALFTSFVNATVIVGKIDELESEADHVEDDLIDRIFSSDLEGIDKILLRDLTRRIAGISDRAENVGDRIRIMVAKRSI
jgi:predicted phosphate transport protein (TIGR00153 family)